MTVSHNDLSYSPGGWVFLLLEPLRISGRPALASDVSKDYSILCKACTPAGDSTIHKQTNWPLELLVLRLDFEMFYHSIPHVVSPAISNLFRIASIVLEEAFYDGNQDNMTSYQS